MDAMTMIFMGTGVFLVAGMIKGISGIGMPTAAIALITLVFDPRTAIALVLFPMIGSNMWQVWRGGELARTARRYAPFAVVLTLCVALTTFATQDTGDRALLAALGCVLLIFVAVSARGLMPPIPEDHDLKAQLGFGLFAGVVGGMTAAWGPPMAMYLATRQVDKDEFIRATGFLIVVGSLPLAISYAQLGFLDQSLAGISLAMLVPTIIGFSLGEALRNRLSVQAFRNVILVVFVVLGINLIRRAIWYG